MAAPGPAAPLPQSVVAPLILAAFKADPRFRALLPVPADFAQPFVEAVNVVREWDGEAANDQFGWIARKLGDVDGDGIADFVTSAPNNATGGENAGAIYVYSSRSGKLLWRANGEKEDQLGLGVECAGDTNGDGVVNTGDALQTRNRSGQTTDATNFRSDVNVDGLVNSGDSIIVRSRSGTSLP